MKEKAPYLPPLTSNDLPILQEIWAHGFRTYEELYELFLKAHSRSYRYRRMKKLVKLGYLVEQKTRNGILIGWKASSKRELPNHLRLSDVSKERIKPTKYFSSYNHDIELRMLQDRLLKVPVISEFKTEKLLRQVAFEKAKGFRAADLNRISESVPDGIFKLQVKDRLLQVALELELSMKAKVRIEDKIERYIYKNSYDLSLYVCGSDRILRKLLRIYENILSHSPRVRFAKYKAPVYFTILSDTKIDLLGTKIVSLHDSFKLQDLI